MQKVRKINKNKMENIKASVGGTPTLVNEIRKNILNRTLKKIEDISEKTDEILKMDFEFYELMRKTPHMKSIAEQEQTKKKIDTLRREIKKKWGTVWREKIEIFAIIDTLYILSETKSIKNKVKGSGETSWADVRREIKKKMEKTLVDEKAKK